jgi:hypothetical protein
MSPTSYFTAREQNRSDLPLGSGNVSPIDAKTGYGFHSGRSKGHGRKKQGSKQRCFSDTSGLEIASACNPRPQADESVDPSFQSPSLYDAKNLWEHSKIRYRIDVRCC